jgi:hypothetical protein
MPHQQDVVVDALGHADDVAQHVRLVTLLLDGVGARVAAVAANLCMCACAGGGGGGGKRPTTCSCRM